MQYSTLALAAATLLTGAQAVGNAIVQNNCGADLYLWSVGSDVSSQNTIPAGGNYTEAYRTDPKTGGIALKVTTIANGLYIGGTPQFDYSYSLDGSNVWYDAADVFGDPFPKVLIKPSDVSCQTISWPNGSKPPGTPTAVCSSEADVVAYLC